MADARLRAGYSRPDDAAAAAGISRDFIYKVERIGNKPNAANPTLDTLETLATLYGVELGDCFPHNAVTNEEVSDILSALSGLSGERRRRAIKAMAAFIRSLYDVEQDVAPHVEEKTPSVTAAYNPPLTSGKADPVETFGVEGLTEAGGKSDATAGRLGKATQPARKGKLAR